MSLPLPPARACRQRDDELLAALPSWSGPPGSPSRRARMRGTETRRCTAPTPAVRSNAARAAWGRSEPIATKCLAPSSTATREAGSEPRARPSACRPRAGTPRRAASSRSRRRSPGPVVPTGPAIGGPRPGRDRTRVQASTTKLRIMPMSSCSRLWQW
jgi:hypothetical protein